MHENVRIDKMQSLKQVPLEDRLVLATLINDHLKAEGLPPIDAVWLMDRIKRILKNCILNCESSP